MKINSSIVSSEWLHTHLETPNLVILNATILNATDISDNIRVDKQIPHTRFFDIKNKFSDISAPFPSTFPSENQFTREAKQLGINKDSAIVVYDDKGIYSSARAWWLFKAFGHNNVAVLDGGLPEWKRANYSTQQYQPYQGKVGDFIALETKKRMKFFEDIKTESQNKSHVIMDARSQNRFQCLVDEPRQRLRRGRIPNSVNLPFEDLLDGFCLKPVDELKLLFSDLAKPSDRLTFSCGSGITACILALGADIASYEHLSVYDGSWTEYGTLTTEDS